MRPLIFIGILTLFATNVFADNHEELGRYTCTIKTTQLVKIEDGVPKIYSGYEQFKVGDKLIFKIDKGYQGAASVDLQFSLVGIDDTEIYDFGFINDAVIQDRTKRIVASSDLWAHGITEDLMFFNDRRLSFHRYFKTDYSLMWVQLPYEGNQRTHVVTADCRANKHAFPAIFDFVNY